jgi:hypothetical protein
MSAPERETKLAAMYAKATYERDRLATRVAEDEALHKEAARLLLSTAEAIEWALGLDEDDNPGWSKACRDVAAALAESPDRSEQ